MSRLRHASAFASSCLAFGLVLGLPDSAQAQVAVQISGTVTDPTGKPVAGARIQLGSQGLTAFTDAQGRYQILRSPSALAGPGIGRDGLVPGEGGMRPALIGNRLHLELDGTVDGVGLRDVKIALYTLDGRKAVNVLDARLTGGSPAAKPSGSPAAAGATGTSGAAAGDTLTLVAVGYQREDRGVETLSGIQDFKLKALGYANVPYKSGPSLAPYEIERCKLDVHIPAAAAGRKLPVVLHLHGGGLHGGDKNEGWFDGDNWFSRKLMEEGLIIFSANYRLGQDPDLPKNPKHVIFPEYLRDAAAAVAWVRRNLESYGGDPKNFFVSGYSAGAWLAAMIAVDTSYYKAVGFNPRDLNGYLAFSAQTYTYGQVAWERGISDRGITDGALLSHVRKHDIPMALFVGGNEGQRITDMQVWLKQMQDAGSTRMTLSIQAGRDHKQLVTTMGNAADDTRTKVMAFIRQYSAAP